MRPHLLSPVVLLLGSLASAQPAPASYQVRYAAAGDPLVHVSLSLPAPAAGPLHFVMPRAIPGGYAQQEYDRYLRDLKAFADERTEVTAAREDGPRWLLGRAGERVGRVEYAVDVPAMEREIFDASDTSKQREGYVGLLGYSVFGYIEGMENAPVRLEIQAPEGWPAFVTLAP